MGVIRRIADFARAEIRGVIFRPINAAAAPLLSGAGVPVTVQTAEQVAAVSAAIDCISSMLASLPVLVYRVEGRGKIEVEDSPVARLLEAPNEAQTRSDLVAWLMRQVLRYGNGLLEIERGADGAPVALIPHPWPQVSTLLTDARRLVYEVHEIGGTLGSTSRKRRLLADEVIHLRDHSDDGLIGVPRITRCSQAIAVALAAQEFSASYFRNGARPSGVLSIAAKLGGDALGRIRENLEAVHGGPANAARVLIVDSGSEFTPISGTAEQSELVEARRFNVEEIARVFGVPLIFLMSMSEQNYAAVARAFELLAVQTLAPWCTKLEALLTRALFSDEMRATHRIEIDLSGLTRGDFGARWAAWKIARETGVLTPDEVREAEGYGPLTAPTIAGDGDA